MNIHKEAAISKITESSLILMREHTEEERERARQLTDEAHALILEAYGFENH